MTYRRRDSYYKRAKRAGYRARSAYKLAELDDRFGLISPGDSVVDLGAWPGGWLQIVAERMGPKGRAVGVDVVPVDPLPFPSVSLIAADVRDPSTIDQVLDQLGGPADVVLSDLSPKLTGVRATDEERRSELATATIASMPRLLRPGGRLLMKVFMDPGYAGVVTTIRGAFRIVKTTRSDATRRGSAELYVIGLEHHHKP